jgi:hypothetical protein
MEQHRDEKKAPLRNRREADWKSPDGFVFSVHCSAPNSMAAGRACRPGQAGQTLGPAQKPMWLAPRPNVV